MMVWASAGKLGEESIPAGGVEFAEDVVQQQHRGFFMQSLKVAGLGDFEGQDDAALLSLRGEG